jgi:hypothetical protein
LRQTPPLAGSTQLPCGAVCAATLNAAAESTTLVAAIGIHSLLRIFISFQEGFGGVPENFFRFNNLQK